VVVRPVADVQRVRLWSDLSHYLVCGEYSSFVKFIERNWHLGKLSDRRDNLPNPRMHDDDDYVPVNMPVIGDLFDMFDFDRGDRDDR
jgi:phospholipase C